MRKWLVVALLLTTLSMQQTVVDAAVMRLDKAALVQQVFAAERASWKDLYKAGPAPFAWDPDQVVVLDSGDLALSTGKVTDASGKVLVRCNSIWRRQRNGQWQVVFDKGSPVCAPPPPAAGS